MHEETSEPVSKQYVLCTAPGWGKENVIRLGRSDADKRPIVRVSVCLQQSRLCVHEHAPIAWFLLLRQGSTTCAQGNTKRAVNRACLWLFIFS